MFYFLSGALMMGYAFAALFFVRFWTQTHDRFFAIFGAAFGLLSVERLFLAFLSPENETGYLVYLIRLMAFTLILGAIVDKNRKTAD